MKGKCLLTGYDPKPCSLFYPRGLHNGAEACGISSIGRAAGVGRLMESRSSWWVTTTTRRPSDTFHRAAEDVYLQELFLERHDQLNRSCVRFFG